MGMLSARISFVPSLIFNIVMEKLTSRRWYDRIDHRVILGALPFKSMTKKLVEDENVRGVVSLNETYELKWLSNMEKEWSAVGVKFLQLDTVDIFESPSQEKLKKGVQFIREFEENNVNGNVYVHCKAGRTRSATLVACFLMEKYHWSPEEAQQCILEKRPHVWLGAKQKQALQEYFNSLHSS